MKRLVLICSSLLLLIGCGQAAPTPPSEVANTPAIVVAQPNLVLDKNQGGPNTEIVANGSGFPTEAWIVIRLGITTTNLSQSYAQIITDKDGEFETSLMMPTTWKGADLTGQTELVVVAETADHAIQAIAPFTLKYDGAFKTYADEEVGFALDIPQDWNVTDAQITPLGKMVLLGLGDNLTSGDPQVSTILVGDTADFRTVGAVNLLRCGTTSCQDEVVVGITSVGGIDARTAVIGSENTPELEWFFIEYNGRLVYFSLHDPTTLQTLEPMVNTFRLLETISDTESAAVSPTDTPTDIPEPTEAPTETPEPSADDSAAVVEDNPTETATNTATATSTTTPTETVVPTETDTPTVATTTTNTPSPTANSTPSPSPTISPTQQPTATRPDPTTAGPVQTIINLVLIILRDEVAEDIFDYYSEAQRETITSVADVGTSLLLDFAPSNFEANRVQDSIQIIVEVQFTNRSGAEAFRYFYMVEEGDRWRIASIQESADGQIITETVTPEATNDAESTVGAGDETSNEGTPTAEATAVETAEP